jgi:hypothetical protein
LRLVHVKRAGRELRRTATPGYHCSGCDELWTVVRVGRGEAELPTEVGCPSCWADLVPVAIVNVNGRSYWYPAGRSHARLLGKVLDAPGCGAVP